MKLVKISDEPTGGLYVNPDQVSAIMPAAGAIKVCSVVVGGIAITLQERSDDIAKRFAGVDCGACCAKKPTVGGVIA